MNNTHSLQFIAIQQQSLVYANDAQTNVVMKMIDSVVEDLLKPLRNTLHVKVTADIDRLNNATLIYNTCNQIAGEVIQLLGQSTFATFFNSHVTNLLTDTQRILVDAISAPTLRPSRRNLNIKIEEALVYCSNVQ